MRLDLSFLSCTSNKPVHRRAVFKTSVRPWSYGIQLSNVAIGPNITTGHARLLFMISVTVTPRPLSFTRCRYRKRNKDLRPKKVRLCMFRIPTTRQSDIILV